MPSVRGRRHDRNPAVNKTVIVLKGKNIIVGVTGSIAAYKAAMLVRALVRAGADVRVLMTPLAKEFITPLTMATLSKHPILVEFFNPENGEWNSHVSLGEWADALVIAPATANTMAKMASGTADNLLLTTYLSARCPVFVAPAMDLDMYAHPATQANIALLRERGVAIIEPAEGELASGLSGKGRMAEPEEIAAQLDAALEKKKRLTGPSPLRGLKFIVTAGPTTEAIDPVRFISNHSSGKMGYAIAGELAARGADVTLVSGRTALPAPDGVRRVDVVSAADMFRETTALWPSADGAVMCAAVADYTPAEVSATKMKKGAGQLSIELVPTADIAAELGRTKRAGQLLVGFALETDHEERNALGKLERKRLDFIVLNSLRNEQSCFGYDTNLISILDRSGRTDFPLESKTAAAKHIVDRIVSSLETGRQEK